MNDPLSSFYTFYSMSDMMPGDMFVVAHVQQAITRLLLGTVDGHCYILNISPAGAVYVTKILLNNLNLHTFIKINDNT